MKPVHETSSITMKSAPAQTHQPNAANHLDPAVPLCIPIRPARQAQPVRKAGCKDTRRIEQCWPSSIRPARTVPFEALERAGREPGANHEALLTSTAGLDTRRMGGCIDPFERYEDRQAIAACDYLAYDFLHSQICLHTANRILHRKARSLEGFLSLRALCHGSSLKGRRQAACSMLGIRKQVPVLISHQPLELWLPTAPKQDAGLLYLNFARITSILPVQDEDSESLPCPADTAQRCNTKGKAKKNRVRVRFCDGLELELSSSGAVERVFRQGRTLCALLSIPVC